MFFFQCVILFFMFLYCFHIFNRIMSVNYQRASEQIKEIISINQDHVFEQLQKYKTYLAQSQNQIQNTITITLSHLLNEQQLYKTTISQLQYQVAQLKEDNSYLRNQYMNSVIKQEQLKKSRLRVMQENTEKEERVRFLAEQVENIKNYMNKSQNLPENEEIVNFDDEDSPIKLNKFQGLETIREVSEHDLSMTMSLQSFKSDMLDDFSNMQTAFQTPNDSISNQQVESKQSLGTENYQIENYQDALMILKSYNSNGRAMKMTKKPMIEVAKSCSDQPLLKDSIKKIEKKGNQTINKIKKMRKIQDLDVQGKAINKSNQQNIFFQGNENYKLDQSGSIIQSKMQYLDECPQTMIQGKTKSSSSINSNKFISRIKENYANLQDPIKRINQIINQINSANSHPIKKQNIKDQFKRITYVGGLQFTGHCNEHDEPSGFGKLLFNKDIVFQGQWRCGKFHGWGKLILLSFVKERQKMIIEVDGHFKYGMMQGSVVCTFTTGQKFMGIIKNQNIEKQGTFVSQKGIMTGIWQSNKLIYLI